MTQPDAAPETEVAEEGSEFFFEPAGAAQLADGDVYISDVDAFMEATKALAVMTRDGVLFVLGADFKWRNVEDPVKAPKPRGALSVIK